MPMNNTMVQAFLDLFFLNSAFANVGDVPGLQPSATAGNFWLSLHTADPGAGGNQTTSEATYTGYGRVSVARSGSGWIRTGNVISPLSTIVFGADTAGTQTLTHAGIGSASSGAGHLWWSGAITPNIAVAVGITPELTTASTVTIA
jgi:hypothetical protein